MFSEAATNSLKILAERVRDAQGLVALATVAQRSPEQPDRSPGFQPGDAGTPKKFLKAWRQWEIDTDRKIEAGKKQWDDKIKTFLVSKQNWQEEIKTAAMEQSLDKMLAATGSNLNERLRVLAANANIQTDIPEMNVTDLVAQAMQDFESNRPSSERIFGQINQSINAFNVTLELGNATHFKGFNNGGLEENFAQNMETFSKQMGILNNVKLYENFKKMIESFKESLKKNDGKVAITLEGQAVSYGYTKQGANFNKDAGMWGDYDFIDYRKADIDGMMNRAMLEAGMTQLSSEDMVSFLKSGRDVDVKLFFEVQTMALEQAFKIVGGDQSKKGLYGDYVGDIAEWKGAGGDLISEGSGELGGWSGGSKVRKLTYRGLHEEETRLKDKQGAVYTAMNVTGSIVGAVTGNLWVSLAMAAANTTVQTGAAFASGNNGWGQLAMGAIQGAGAFAGSFLGGLDYGLGKIGNAVTGVAAQQTTGYLMSGFQMESDGSVGYKGPSRGAGMSALVQGGFAMLGAGINARSGLGGSVAGSTVSTTFNAIGSGFQFNDDGSMGAYSLQKAGTSFAANMASTVASGYAGNISKSDFVGTQMGRLANTVTASLLGDKNAWNAYSPQGIFNTLGTYAGGEMAKAVNNRGASEGSVPANQQPFRELIGGGAIIAARREEGKDQDVLGGILEGFKAIGSTAADAGSAIGSGVSSAAGWIANAASKVGNAVIDVASVLGSALKTAAVETGTFFKEQVGQRLANLFEHGSLRNNAELSKYTTDAAYAMEDPNAAMEYLIAAKEKGLIGEKEIAEARSTLFARQSAEMNPADATALDWKAVLRGNPTTSGLAALLDANSRSDGASGSGSIKNRIQLATEVMKANIVIIQKYGDQIESMDDKFFYLKDGKGKILRDAPRVDQRDNETDDYLGQERVLDKKTGKYVMKDLIVNWKNMCNLTVAAALLMEKGIVAKGDGQLEDELYNYFTEHADYKGQKPSANVPNTFKMAINPNFNFKAMAIDADDTDSGDLTDFIKAKIDSGIPVGVSGDFPRAGDKPAAHIIGIIGYNEKGWIVNDPYGAYKNSTVKWQHTGTQGTAELYPYQKYRLTEKRAYWLEKK